MGEGISHRVVDPLHESYVIRELRYVSEVSCLAAGSGLGDLIHTECERLVVSESREVSTMNLKCRMVRYIARRSQSKALYLISGLRSCLLKKP